MTTSNWVPVLGFESHYEVSDIGEVRRKVDYFASRLSQPLRPVKTWRGYLRVSLSVAGVSKIFTIHRLVLSSFDKDNKNMEINHKDGNKENNARSNLEWCTRAENVKHAKNNFLYKGKLDAELIAQIKLTKEETKLSNRELGRIFNLTHPTIAEALKK